MLYAVCCSCMLDATAASQPTSQPAFLITENGKIPIHNEHKSISKKSQKWHKNGTDAIHNQHMTITIKSLQNHNKITKMPKSLSIGTTERSQVAKSLSIMSTRWSHKTHNIHRTHKGRIGNTCGHSKIISVNLVCLLGMKREKEEVEVAPRPETILSREVETVNLVVAERVSNGNPPLVVSGTWRRTRTRHQIKQWWLYCDRWYRNETTGNETKRNETKRNETKRDETKGNETRRNET